MLKAVFHFSMMSAMMAVLAGCQTTSPVASNEVETPTVVTEPTPTAITTAPPTKAATTPTIHKDDDPFVFNRM